MTKRASGTSTVTYCTLQGHNISIPGRIDLPDNISKLNEYIFHAKIHGYECLCALMKLRFMCEVLTSSSSYIYIEVNSLAVHGGLLLCFRYLLWDQIVLST